MTDESKVDILLVDDNPKNLVALEAMLSDLGQNLVQASSGEEALKRLLHQDFALALLDIQMPGMDGFEVASLIRERERSRHMPIIFLTAFNRTEAQVFRGYSVGAVDFLFKPIDSYILRSKVMVFVDLFRKTEEIRRQAVLLREAEQRDHERQLQEAARRWETERLREEMEEERRVAEALASKNEALARTEAALRQSNLRLGLLSDVANHLLLDAHPQDFLSNIFGQLSTLLGLEIYLSYLVRDGALHLESSRGLGEAELESRRVVQLGDRVPGRTAATRQRQLIEDVQASTDPELADSRAHGITAHVCYPLLAGERLLGTLSFLTLRRSHFDPEDLSLMQVVCDQVAMALERDRLIDELSRRNDDLAQADRRKDEFLAMLAHELRNPLAPVLNAVQVLRQRDSQDALVRRAQDAISRQVRHMARLVDDLLDISRVTRGKVELRREPVSLSSIVEHATATSGPLIKERNHTLTVTLPPHEVYLFADATRMQQIVSNLLNNSAKYSPPGGRIELEARVDGQTLCIMVTDHGLGIHPELLERIFDLFVQSERSPDRSQGGLGIGLTLVRRLVEMHGGEVVAESEGQGKGSRFTVRLPLGFEDQAELQPEESRPPSPHLSGAPPPAAPDDATEAAMHIALIEDSEDLREMLQLVLEERGHRVEGAEDGPRGIELVLRIRPDVALIDIGLPGLDGYEVARRLRKEMAGAEKRPNLIALTGYGRPEDRARALDAGFDAHLVKPVDPLLLFRLLAELRAQSEL